MPAVRHPALGIHPLDGDLDGHLPMAGQGDLAVDTPVWRKVTFELHAEPGAELLGAGKGTPYTRLGCAQNDLFLDAVGSVMQLHGCILPRPLLEMQPTVCISNVRGCTEAPRCELAIRTGQPGGGSGCTRCVMAALRARRSTSRRTSMLPNGVRRWSNELRPPAMSSATYDRGSHWSARRGAGRGPGI